MKRMSDMPGPKVYNVWWGDYHALRKQKGVTTYTLSSVAQNPTSHMVRDTIINGYRRLAKEFVFWAVPASLVYSVYYWADTTYHFQNSKAGHIAALKEGGEHH
ncbi:unnamed protein product [Peniophora sp. CBMAI 1063]|nr:unnamed protein product [Peniophora sp. CBMAI 1063]